MKITVFTCNQPRHLDLVERLSAVGDTVFAVIETKTSFPGVRPAVHPRAPALEAYFKRMQEAERQLFGSDRFVPSNVRTMSLYMGDASYLPLESFGDALNADLFVVFGASYLKGELVKFLVARECINIHMGVSPYYRGSACNFWALADQRPELVGATIHLLSEGLDSGPILFHAMPEPRQEDGFMLGMRAVHAANKALVACIRDRSIVSVTGVPQDRSKELRYSRSKEFTPEVADEYLRRMPTPEELMLQIQRNRSNYELRNPVYL